MNKTSIIILSYNTYLLTKQCIESIRKYTDAGSYEIIVVDNHSQDPSVGWLKKQADLKVIYNKENAGFPKGCNQGMAIAEQGNDILLLNSDTIVTPHWLENLQTALYSDKTIGVAGCVTNSCSNWQQVEVNYKNLDELMDFARAVNQSNKNLWEIRPRLVGFCYLIKNEVYRQLGGLDEQFSPGNYEDDDYSLRVIMAGYKLLLCRDSFIHHYGSASFAKAHDEVKQAQKIKKYNTLLRRNKDLFLKKWQVTESYGAIHQVVFEVDLPAQASPRIFVIGCSMGMDLCYLKNKYPHAELSGVTENWAEAALAGKLFDVCYCPDTENDVFVLLTGKYNYILLADEQKKYQDFDGYINKLFPYLAADGSIHISQ